ncbi:MAG TPA: gamma-glutamyl-gamma-aminobutyrate hydrolase family protein [Alphaproteobacteria bacterium]|nr:gamma-glutamyl-gamma-aminobutyrate hydrolase family protein [Alphaproteobacteria bacterium]
MPRPPVIGITADREEPGAYSNKPWYALRENYCEAVERTGGLALVLPHAAGGAVAYAETLDGVVISGGNFDVDPALFGASSRHQTVTTKDARTDFEAALAQAALERDLPVLGICGGQQLLNVVLGGTLIQHIPDEVPGALAHEQPNSRDEPGHTVALAPGTLLYEIVGSAEMAVNSAHHQAAAETGEGVTVNATAADGVIEGIEARRYRFCLGVQWHPEYDIDPGDAKIFAAFVAAARAHK